MPCFVLFGFQLKIIWQRTEQFPLPLKWLGWLQLTVTVGGITQMSRRSGQTLSGLANSTSLCYSQVLKPYVIKIKTKDNPPPFSQLIQEPNHSRPNCSFLQRLQRGLPGHLPFKRQTLLRIHNMLKWQRFPGKGPSASLLRLKKKKSRTHFLPQLEG